MKSIITTTKILHKTIPKKPLLFTFHNTKKNNKQTISTKTYITLNHTTINNNLINIINLKLFTNNNQIKKTITYTHTHNIKIIISNHNFHKTPKTKKIITHLHKIQSFNTNIPKITLIPQNTNNILTLLTTTLKIQKQYTNHPIITISITKTNIISHLTNKIFNSTTTFNTIKKTSTPEQISINNLHTILTILHQT